MTNQNQTTYSAANIVNYYEQLQLLQPAEKIILERLRPQLSTMDMLDIGVGGGRTTQHFAPLVKSYVGIDYSAAMIEACKRRFEQSQTRFNFSVGDARNMAEFADNSFDFILFSFNGIDYVDHGDRLKIFQEIKRIGRPNCYVLFSSHNLQVMEKGFQWRTKISFNPLNTYTNLVMLALLKLCNLSITQKKLASSKYLIIRDESHNFRLKTYYIRVQDQVLQLEKSFNNVEVYSWQSGLEIKDNHDRALTADEWLYYFCEIR
ncbi:MAG: class I SAM-dependent methyltransferase [Limnothrix sp. RL_2_0]|nr:class I SAM-dependent methyltransferase [Limnothrix sp. RL_2_0]